MKIIENKSFDQERALYGVRNVKTVNCRFEGPADGESALKECERVTVDGAFMNLRYPFWHDHGLALRDVEMTELCRAALCRDKLKNLSCPQILITLFPLEHLRDTWPDHGNHR